MNELLSKKVLMIDNFKEIQINKEYYVKKVTNYLNLHFYCSLIEFDSYFSQSTSIHLT
jgi:hypothetical protein